ncbi:MAG: hypothetical protein UCI88_01875, partial [Megasphaera massiliensis]|nr:hypothetical protein [Megasphaera massiliensis]
SSPLRYAVTTFNLNSVLYFTIKNRPPKVRFLGPTLGGRFKHPEYFLALKEKETMLNAWQSGYGAVSVGRVDATRQITNVAAGSEDSDAVNVAQLKALNNKLNNKIIEENVHYFSVNTENIDDSESPAGTNWNNDGATGKRAIAIGRNASTKGPGSIAIGDSAKIFNVNTQYALVIGENAESAHGSIVIGRYAKDYDTDPTKAGNGIFIGEEAKSLGGIAQVVLGNSGKVKGQGSIAVGQWAEALDYQSTAVGQDAKALGETSLAFGAMSIAENKNSMALGAYTNARGQSSLAVGRKSIAAGHDSVAIGNQSYAHNGYIYYNQYIALSPEEKEKYIEFNSLYLLKDMSAGSGSKDAYLNTAVGAFSNAKKHAATFGGSSTAEEKGTAIGTYAKANEQGAVALGYSANGNVENGVAIGAYSVADREKGKIGYALGGDNSSFEEVLESTGQKARYDALTAIIDPLAAEYNGYVDEINNATSTSRRNAAKRKLEAWLAEHTEYATALNEKQQIIDAWQSVNGAVSVGAVGATRQITNVAAGSEDTDAVNVAQLKALNIKVDDNSVKYFSVKPTYYDDNTELVDETVNADNQGATGNSSIAIGAGATTNAANSLAIGHKATISDNSANGQTAIGYKATASGQESVALGSSASADGVSVALGGSAKSTALGVAVGYNAKSSGSGGISVGNNAESNFRTVAVGVGAQGNSESSVAVGSEAATFANSSVATGSKSAVYGSGSIAIGTEAVVKSTVITPDEYNALSDDEKALYVGAAFATDKFGEKTPTQYMKVENRGAFYNGMAIGTGATVSASNGMALGTVSRANGENSVAVGRRATSNVTDGVALGAWSAVDRASGVYGYTVDGVTFDSDEALAAYMGKTAEYKAANDEFNSNVVLFNEKNEALQKDPNNEQLKNEVAQAFNAAQVSFEKRNAIVNAYKSGLGAVSVGNSVNTRQITGVAAGSEDTDAVNVAQLKALHTKVDANQIEYVSIKSSETENKLNDGATGDNSIAIGPKTKVTAASAVAIGSQSEISNSNFGSAYGATSKVTGSEQGTAVGYGALVDKSLFGTALGTRANVTDSIQGTAVGQSAIVSGSNYGTSLGTFSKVTNSDSGIAIGSMANVNNANYGMAIGINSSVTNQGGTALGYGTSVTEKSGVALGLGAAANRSAEVYGYSPDGVTFTDDASVAAYLGKTAEFEQAHQDYVEKVQIFQEKLAAYQQDPKNPDVINAYIAAANAMTESFNKRTGIIAAYKSSYGAVSVGGSGATRQIINVAAGTEDSDAVNLAQLKTVETIAKAHTELTLDGKSATAGANGELGKYIGDNNLTMAVKDLNGQKVYDLKLKNEVVIGQPGKDGKDGKPGSIGLVGPQGPAGEDGQPGKNAYGEISVKNGVDGVDGKHGKDGITRIVYEDEKGEEHTVATLEDGLKFAGDTENVTIPKKLNETLEVKGGISDSSLLTDNNIGILAKANGGLTVKLAKNLNLSDGSVAFAEVAKDKDGNVLVKGEDGNWYTDLTDAVYDADSQTYTKDGATLTAVESPVVGAVKLSSTGLDNGNQRIVNVAAGINGMDAVNVDQLDAAISKVSSDVGGAHTELTLDGKSAKAGANGALGDYIGDNNLTMAVKDVNGQKVYDLKLKNEVVIGQPGKDGKDGTPGSIGLVGPQGPAGEDGQPGKNAYGEISVKNGVDGVDGKHGKDGITRIVYEDEKGEEHTVATLEDGLKFAGDTKDVTIAKKLNETLDIRGGISDEDSLVDNNIGVVAKSDGGLTVKLAKKLDLADGSITIASEVMKDEKGNWLVKGEDGNWYTDLTDAVYNADTQTYTKNGETLTAVESPIVGTVKLSSAGLDNGNQRIVNVATGIDDMDAVNVAQLDAAISKVSSDVGGAHTELTLDGKEATAGADGKLGEYIGDNNLTMAVKDVNGQKVYDLKLKNEVVIGQPGKDGKDGTPGSIGLVGPAGPKGEDGQPGKNAYGEISVKNGVDGVDGKHGKDGITRIVYEDERGEEHTVATLEDGLKFAGDTENVTIAKKLNETLEVKGGISDTTLLTDNNIGVVAKSDGGLTVKLAKNLDLADGSVRIGGTTGEDGAVTGGIYIAKQKGVATTKDGETEDGSFIIGLTNTKWDPDTNGIVSGRAATEDQLEKAISKVSSDVGGAHTELTLDGKSAKAGADGALGDYIGDNNLTMAVKDVNGQKVYDLKLKNEVVIGQPGKDGKDGTPGSIGLVGPPGPAGEDGQPGKNAYGEISVKNGADGVDGKHGKDGITRIVYEDENGEEHTVATLEDGLKFAGDT